MLMTKIDTQILEDVIQELINIYGLNPSLKNLFINNVLRRAHLYENISVPQLPETKVIKNIDDQVAFFLNRLINNIRDYNFEKDINLDGGKGDYINGYQQLNMHSYESIKQAVQYKLANYLDHIDEKSLNLSVQKVLNHEIGHALQTYFTGAVGYNDKKFSSFLNRLHDKYPDIFFSCDELPSTPLAPAKTGMKVKEKNDEYAQARHFYAINAFTTHLDEIFNEEEALAVTNIDKPQFTYSYNETTGREVYNYDSSNYRITPYATMMKILLGKERTFKCMYSDSMPAYIYFDEFLDESKEVFKNSKAPMFNILECLNNIKTAKDVKSYELFSLSLDLFFTKCFEKKMNIAISQSQLDAGKLDVLLSRLDAFAATLVKSSKTLKTKTIINSLQEKLLKMKAYLPETLLEELDDDEPKVVLEGESQRKM